MISTLSFSKSNIPFARKYYLVMRFEMVLHKWCGWENNFMMFLVTTKFVKHSLKAQIFPHGISGEIIYKKSDSWTMWNGEYMYF